MDEKLPENVIPLKTLKINRNIRKHCTCDRRTFTIDNKNREVTCNECGVVVSAFDALYEIATNWERFHADIERLHKQRKEIANYKPHLLKIRDLEREYRGGKMLPCCPRCKRGILLEEITWYTNKEMELQRRKFEAENNHG